MTVFPAKKGTKRHSKHLVSVSMRYLSYLSSEDFSIVSPLKQFFIMIRCSGFTRCAHSWVIELNTRREILYIYISTRAHELFPIRDGVLVWFVMTFGTHLMHMLFLNSSPLIEQRDHYSLPHLDMGHGTWDGCNVIWWHGTLWLKNTVFRCRHKGWRGSNCGHWEDASVRCDSTWRKTYF